MRRQTPQSLPDMAGDCATVERPRVDAALLQTPSCMAERVAWSRRYGTTVACDTSCFRISCSFRPLIRVLVRRRHRWER